MKITSIRIKEDLAWRLNTLKYQWGYKTLDHVIRHLLSLKTPKLISAKSHQNSSTTPLFIEPSDNSLGGAVNNHRDAEVEDKGTRCKTSSPDDKKEEGK